MNFRECYAATGFASLEWSDISERPIDRVAAAGLCKDPLGVLIWKSKYCLESVAYREAQKQLSERLKEKYPLEAGLILDKLAEQCLREYLSDKCKACHGAREMIVGSRRITCEVCSGFGIRRWTDFERARGTGLAIGRVKTLERKFSWTVNLLLTLDSEVNRQIEFYLGRTE
jgi:hypothetical protein